MKIFCSCNFCYRKVYLASDAKSRQQLLNNWGRIFTINCVHCQRENKVDVNSVNAESSYAKAPIPTTLAGGFVGALAGPLGIIIGLAAGATSGALIRSKDKEAVKRFNIYYV